MFSSNRSLHTWEEKGRRQHEFALIPLANEINCDKIANPKVIKRCLSAVAPPIGNDIVNNYIDNSNRNYPGNCLSNTTAP